MKRINIHTNNDTLKNADILASEFKVSRSKIFRMAIELLSEQHPQIINDANSTIDIEPYDVINEQKMICDLINSILDEDKLDTLRDFQIELFESFKLNKLNVIHKSRQIGMSTFMMAYFIIFANNNPGKAIKIVSYSSTTRKLLEQTFNQLINKASFLFDINCENYTLDNSSSFSFISQNEITDHKKNDAHIYFFDEYAFYSKENEEFIRTKLINSTAQFIFSSTNNGFNHFYHMCKMAYNDQNWKLFTYDMEHCISGKEKIEIMKLSMDEIFFDREFKCKFAEYLNDRHN